MYCSKCGNELKKDSLFCGKCGKSIKENDQTKKFDLSFIKNKVIVIPCLLVFVGTLIYIISFNIGKSNLSNELLRDWSRVETGEKSTIYTLELDFSKNTIKYNFISTYSWLNTTIGNYEYKVISPNKIKINDRTYTIKFGSNKTTMTITPALTRVEDSETWFNFD